MKKEKVLRVLLAPVHYRLEDGGSEMGWGFAYAKYLRLSKQVVVSIITGSVTNEIPEGLGGEILPLYTEKFPVTIAATSKFHFDIWKRGRALLKDTDILHHFLPFGKGRTVSPLILSRAARGLKIVVGPIGATPTWGGPPTLLEKLLLPVLNYFSLLTLKKADAIVVLEETTKAELAAKIGRGDHIHVIPPGIDLTRYTATVRKWKQGEALELLSVGHLLPHKGGYIAAQAVRQLLDQGLKVRLHLLGDGPDREKIKAYIREQGLEDSVILHGRVAPSEVDAYYRQAHLYVAMSSFESWGQASYLEALASGLPLVTFVNEGAAVIMQDAVSGYRVPKRTPESLASVVATIMSAPELITAMSKEARKLGETNYDWSTVLVPHYLTLYQSLVSDTYGK